jgi:hypothetical protein
MEADVRMRDSTVVVSVSPRTVVAKMVVQTQPPGDIARMVMPILPREIDSACRLAMDDRIQAARVQLIVKTPMAVLVP